MPISSTKPRSLSRFDIRRRLDRATKSAVLEYTGKALTFHDRVYGYSPSVFLVVSYDEMPFPPELVALSDELHIPLDSLNVAKQLKDAAVDAVIAEGMVDAPRTLSEFAAPDAFWQAWDLRELERRHVIALARVVEYTKLAEREMLLRATKVTFDPGLPPALAPMPLPPLFERAPVLAPEPEVVEALAEVIAEQEAPKTVSAQAAIAQSTVDRVATAVAQARETELSQRLPNGARRALQKLVKAQYVIRGADAPSVRGDLLEAMKDAEAMATGMRKTPTCDVEVTVVDWDGEWPVVVRRYGEGGRTVYRVEDALKRSGAEEKAA